jgi:hypothetical protein
LKKETGGKVYLPAGFVDNDYQNWQSVSWRRMAPDKPGQIPVVLLAMDQSACAAHSGGA